MARGTCRCCGNEYTINADGTMRYHIAADPECQDEQDRDSRKCRGAGQRPDGDDPEPGTAGYICRNCKHPVVLTANDRARSHLDPRTDEPCGGGSDYPLRVNERGERTDMKPGEVLPAAGPEELRMSDVATAGDGSWSDPHRYAADVAIAEAERIQREQDTAYEQSVRDGLEESRRKIHDLNPRLNRSAGECEHDFGGHDVLAEDGSEDQVSACLRCGVIEPEGGPGQTPTAECEHDWSREHKGMEDQVSACLRCGVIESDTLPNDPRDDEDRAGLFDVVHAVPLGDGYEEAHPGEAGDCRLPGCCTHPQGFEYVDDLNGHSGSFCRLCGAEEPEPCTHPGGRTYAGTDEDGEDVWACGHCGERENPAVTRMKAPGRARCRVSDLDEGVLFVRHTQPEPVGSLVYRAGAPAMGPLSATVVSAGPYGGRTGSLTNLTEEVTCTDLNGRPRARRDHPPGPGTGGTSPSSPALSPSPPTPSAPARPTPSRTKPGPSSTPATPASASSAGTTSMKATSSGASGTVTSTRTASGSGRVPDAFSTPKEAVKESDKYDSYGRYKMLHPVSGKKVNWTRATTFCKSIQDTYALSMWSQRMVLKGASLRKDLTAAAGTLEVKADKDRMNGLVDEAKKAAGDKIAANKGTAVHSYTEDRDKELVGMPHKDREVPEEFVPTVEAYAAVLADFGLVPVPGLIEFTTGVIQYDVGGTADRVYQVTRDITIKLNGRPVTLYAGEYVIGDVKTGADLSYGWQEIAIQLALYSQGLNTSGVWDWGTRVWSRPEAGDGNQIQVRTDVGIVPHLPVDRTTTKAPLATLYAVDLTAGWAAAVLCGQVRSWRKERTLATPLEVADVIGDRMIPVRDNGSIPEEDEPNEPLRRAAQKAHEEIRRAPVSRPVAASRPVTLKDKARAVTSKPEASAVYQEAVGARVSVTELNELIQIMQDKLKSFTEQGA